MARFQDEDGKLTDWTLAAEPIADKTAIAEASFIKERVVERLAAAAERLRDELEERYGPTAVALLDPKECRFARLASVARDEETGGESHREGTGGPVFCG